MTKDFTATPSMLDNKYTFNTVSTPSKVTFTPTVDSTKAAKLETNISNLPNVTPIELIKYKVLNEDEDDSFLVGDLGAIYRTIQLWHQHLPNIIPFYAVKCNPDPMVLQLMVDLGLSFDCASKKEIETMKNYGISSNRIIYANPIKQISHLKHAKSHQVAKMTFDNVDELIKIHKYYPEAELLLRILPLDCHSKVPFGTKFGAELATSGHLFKVAKDLRLNIVGLSFHVGSDCLNPEGYKETLRRARNAYDQAKALGIDLKILDIGGGFPGVKNEVEFIEIAKVINQCLEEYFSDTNLTYIAEPGRFFVASFYTLATTIIGKRYCYTENNEKSIMYYLNEGIFKSFAQGGYIAETRYHPVPILFNKKSKVGDFESLHHCTLWGPSCAAIDKINTEADLRLPELEVGDWFYFEHMGAYSTSFSLEFNGFEQSSKIYVNTEVDSLSKLLLK
ncbi:hypothetical protein K502DRAFT_306563 [Neoconidiobolus thromboides FSU 785]|nr:hypothetical protein K502DRAFT_306563 [Neoconidiobolus thromboides FSU 785]